VASAWHHSASPAASGRHRPPLPLLNLSLSIVGLGFGAEEEQRMTKKTEKEIERGAGGRAWGK